LSNIYEKYGYKNRKDYLESLADEYGLSLDIVFSAADLLGESEDFDGLISALQDTEAMGLGDQE
jgi:hypothetical protein